jgi:hypothetical protein
MLDSYMLKFENLSLTSSFKLSWIPAFAGMTNQLRRVIPVKLVLEVFNRGTGIQIREI